MSCPPSKVGNQISENGDDAGTILTNLLLDIVKYFPYFSVVIEPAYQFCSRSCNFSSKWVNFKVIPENELELHRNMLGFNDVMDFM